LIYFAQVTVTLNLTQPNPTLTLTLTPTCSEIKPPLQHVVGAVSRITDIVLPLSESCRDAILEIGQGLERRTQLINLLSDNLLYLTRVEEGRALTLSEQLVKVTDLTVKLSTQHSVIEQG
jgi:hypothetical protein